MNTHRIVFGVGIGIVASALALPGCSSSGSGGGTGGTGGARGGAGGKPSGSGGSAALVDAGGASGTAPDAAVAAGGSQAASVGVSKECLTCLAGDAACGAIALGQCKVVPTCGACLTDLMSKGTGSGCRDTPLLSSMGTCANQNCPDECAAERAGVWKQ
jgi:hypothetical protein